MLADLDDDARAQLLDALTGCVHRLGAGLRRTRSRLPDEHQAT